MAAHFAILGGTGQLGRQLALKLGNDAVALDRSAIELTTTDMVRAVLEKLKSKVVINCAAYNFVDRAESERDTAMAVNAWGAQEVARVCHELGALCVHFSTDYVFGIEAERQTPYAVTDAPGPVSVYGLSKLVGEYAVASANLRHLIVRTCGLYGPPGPGGKGGNFVETMRRLAADGKSPQVVTDQVCTPTLVSDLADQVIELIKAGATGTHHCTNDGACSWFEFAKAVFEMVEAKGTILPITSSERKTAARRPGFSVLRCAAPMRPWREALTEYLRGAPASNKR